MHTPLTGLMLRRVSPQVTAENKLQCATKVNGFALTKIDWKPFNATGVTPLFEPRGWASESAQEFQRIPHHAPNCRAFGHGIQDARQLRAAACGEVAIATVEGKKLKAQIVEDLCLGTGFCPVLAPEHFSLKRSQIGAEPLGIADAVETLVDI